MSFMGMPFGEFLRVFSFFVLLHNIMLFVVIPILIYRWHMATHHPEKFLQRLHERRPDKGEEPDEVHLKRASRGLMISIIYVVMTFGVIPLAIVLAF